MALPILTPTATRLYEAVGPLAFADEEHGYPLAQLAAAYARMLDLPADLSRDEGDRPGWAVLMDPETVPADFLRWLGQFYGVEIPPGVTASDARQRILAIEGFHRGGPA